MRCNRIILLGRLVGKTELIGVKLENTAVAVDHNVARQVVTVDIAILREVNLPGIGMFIGKYLHGGQAAAGFEIEPAIHAAISGNLHVAQSLARRQRQRAHVIRVAKALGAVQRHQAVEEHRGRQSGRASGQKCLGELFPP